MSAAMLFAEVELELTQYAAVAAPERTAEETAAPVRLIARDGWGEPWIPPSSLAGSFRAHLGDETAALLMGEETRDENGDGDGDRWGRPSAVRFLGTQLSLPDGGLAHRGRTAIDRHRAAAGAGLLRHTESLPPGTRLRCRLRVDGAEHHDAVLDALATWRPVIGGGRSTGHGATRTAAIRHDTIDLATPQGRRRWLTEGGTRLFTGAHTRQPEHEDQQPEIRTRWEIADALHIGTGGSRAEDSGPASGEDGRSAEPAPLLRDHRGRPYIPGTTWKGVLRGRCGYILGSLGLLPAACDGGCGGCELCEAFGWAGDDDGDSVSVGARSRLRFTDSPVERATVGVRNHVAIDRVFGGAADGLLFAEEVAESGRLTLEVYVDAAVSATVLAALRLALHDLHTGALGIGGGTTRGHGTLRCVDAAALAARRDEAVAHLAALRESTAS